MRLCPCNHATRAAHVQAVTIEARFYRTEYTDALAAGIRQRGNRFITNTKGA